MYEGSVCVCCMSTDDLLELSVSKMVNNVEENYAKMLSACLSIKISQEDGHESICESCTSRLRDCVRFKSQALKSMCILSSVDLTHLVSIEDIEALGLTEKKKKEFFDETEHTNVDDENALGKQLEKHVNGTDKEEPSISTEPSKITKAKRKIGRPRKYPHNGLPYKISKDELRCRECGEEFPNNITLKVHYNTHFRNHVCGKCDKGFMSLQSLKKHETSHLIGPFRCEACGQEFRNINTLHSHKRYKHGKTATFRCRECLASFTTFNQRLVHEAAAHARNERRYNCRYCDKKFRHGGERAKHISDKHEIKLFPCPLCGAKYKRCYMRAHLLRRHNIGQGFQCAECPLVQPSRSALAKHMQSHLDDRRFVCKLCSKAFVQKCSLKYHIGSHIRRGEYRGDPDYLMVYKKDHTSNDNGLLSDTESEKEEYLDETLLSGDQSFCPSIVLTEDLEQIEGMLLNDERYHLPSDLDVLE